MPDNTFTVNKYNPGEPISLTNVPDDIRIKVAEKIKNKPQLSDPTGLDGLKGANRGVDLKYADMSRKHNWNHFNSDTDYERKAASQQTGYEFFSKMMNGTYKNIQAGIVMDLASYDLQGMYNLAIGNAEENYGNFLFDIANDMLESSAKDNYLFQSGKAWDAAYWGGQTQSSGLSLGIAIASLVPNALLMAVPGGTAVGAGLKTLRGASMASQFAMGTFQGIKEGYSNAIEARDEGTRRGLELGMSAEEARVYGNEIATAAYRSEVGPLMLLNGFQYAMTFGAGTKLARGSKAARGGGMNLGFSGGIETLIEKALPNMTNKVAKWGTEAGVGMITEAAEETWQTYVKQRAIYVKEHGNTDGFDPWNQETVDGAIGGAYGGLQFKVLGSLLSPLKGLGAAKRFNKDVRNFVADLPESQANVINKTIEAENNLQKAMAKYANAPTEANKKEQNNAAFKYKEQLKNSQAHIAFNAMELDFYRGDTIAFDAHIQQMETILEAVSKNDVESLKKFGFLDEKGNEKSEGSLQMIADTFEKNIEDSKKIQTILHDTLDNTTGDYKSAVAITLNEFNTKESIDAVNSLLSEIDMGGLNTNNKYSQLSTDGKERYKIEREIEFLESVEALSDRNRDRLLELRDSLAMVSEYTESDKKLTANLVSSEFDRNINDRFNHNENISKNNEEIDKLKNQEEIAKKIKERKNTAAEKRKEAKLIRSAEKARKKEIKDALAAANKLTPQTNTKVEATAVANNANQAAAVAAEVLDDFSDPITALFGPPASAPYSASTTTSATPANTPVNTSTTQSQKDAAAEADANDEGLTLQVIGESGPTPQQEKITATYEQVILAMNKAFEAKNLPKLTPTEMFNTIAQKTGRDVAYANYNLFKKAYENLKKPINVAELDQNFRDLYGGLDNLHGLTRETQEADETIIQGQEETAQEKIVAKQQPVNLSPEMPVVEYSGPKNITPTFYFGFRGVNFSEAYDPISGEVVRVDDDTLNRESHDVDTILDPNNLLVGEEVRVQMDETFQLEGFEKGSPEWLAEVPIIGFYTPKGGKEVMIGPVVKTVGWWNTDNVGDFSYDMTMTPEQRIEAQQKVIDQAREMHTTLREVIFNNGGIGVLTITKKDSGFPSNNHHTQRNVAQTVPTAQIGAIGYDEGKPVIIIGENKVFEGHIENPLTYKDGSGDTKNLGSGMTVIIKQVGTTPEGKPSYVAYLANELYNQESLQELVKSKWKIYDAVDIVNKRKAPTAEMSLDQANNLLDEVAKVVGTRKNKLLEMEAGGKHVGLGKYIVNLFPKKMSEKYNGKIKMSFERKAAGKIVPIVNDDYSVTGRPYEEVIKEQLHTKHKFYEITKQDGKKDHILFPQPKINFELKGAVIDSATQLFHPQSNKPLQTPLPKNGEIPQGTFEAKVEAKLEPVIATEPIVETTTSNQTEVEAKLAEIERAKAEPIVVNVPAKEPVQALVTQEESQQKIEEARLEEITVPTPIGEEVQISNSQFALVIKEFQEMGFKAVYDFMVSNPKTPLTGKIVRQIVIDSFDNHINNKILPDGSLFRDSYPQEYQELMARRDMIIGIGDFKDSSVSNLSMIGDFIGQELNEVIDTEGINEKTSDRASYEIVVKNTLGLKAKLLLAGRTVVPPHKRMREAFAGFQEFYPLDSMYDGLQQVLANIPNDPTKVVERIEAQIAINPREFGFLDTVRQLFSDKNVPEEIKRELLFRLNQTKVQMFLGEYSKDKSGKYVLRSLNANSRDPKFTIRNYYRSNLVNSSPIVKYNKKGFIIDIKEAEKVLESYDSWANLNNGIEGVSTVELDNWLRNFGIVAEEATLQAYKKANNKPTSTLHHNLAKTLREAVKLQKEAVKNNPDFRFPSKYERGVTPMIAKQAFTSLLEHDNKNYLKDFINLETTHTFHTLKSSYIAGKTIAAFSQPSHASLQVDRLRDASDSEGLKENLNKAAFSKSSILLRLMQAQPRIREGLALSYVSLEPLKATGQSSSSREETVTQMYAGDREATLLSHFVTSDAIYSDFEGFSYRSARMNSPALSDSSQLFLLDTAVLNITEGDLDFNDNGEVVLPTELIELISSQLVKPDLDRIVEFIFSNKSTGISGKDAASQMFTVLSKLNTLKKGESFLLEDVVKAIKSAKSLSEAQESVAVVMDVYKPSINEYIGNYIKEASEAKFKGEGKSATGSWVEYGFYYEEKQDMFNPMSGGFKTKILDNKYLDSKNGKTTARNMSIAAYDYTINYILNQAQWQMLLVGDYTNFFGEDSASVERSPFVVDPITGIPDILSLTGNDPLVEGQEYANKLQEAYSKMEKKASINLSKRLKGLISPGNRTAYSSTQDSEFREYVQLIIEDVENPSPVIENVIKLWYDVSEKDVTEVREMMDTLKKAEEAEKIGSKEATELRKKFEKQRKSLQNKYPLVSEYLKITGTDAQEYTTWQEHLGILRNEGAITDKDYDTIKAKLEKQEQEGVTDENKLTVEEKKSVFQPIKPLHVGMYFGEDPVFTDQTMVYVKTSSFPLLPETTIGDMKLNNVRKNLAKLGPYTRAAYQSGVKVGSLKKGISFSRLSDENITAEELRKSSKTLDRSNFSIQQDKPFKADKNTLSGKNDENNLASQFEDIILGNNINKITKPIFNNSFDSTLLDSLGITPVDGKITGENLYSIYNKIYEEEQKIFKETLYNSLGLDKDGEWNDSIASVEAIRKVLLKQLTNQQDKDILDIIYVSPVQNEKGQWINKHFSKEDLDKENSIRAKRGESAIVPSRAEFNLPLWVTPNSQKMEAVLNATVGNKIIKMRMPGWSSPVGSSQGFKYETEENYKNGGIVYTSEYDPIVGLKGAHYDSVGDFQPAQVLVASKIRDSKGNLIELPVGDDGLLDLSKIDPELLELFSFRIPTSAHQSGSLVKIVGFLPHNQGDLMIVPAEHIVQMGEDYDIDTRYVYSYNTITDKNGVTRKFTREDLDKEIANIDNFINSEQDFTKASNDLMNSFSVFKEDEEFQAMLEEEGLSIENKRDYLKNKVTQLYHQNNLTDIYKSVFSTSDKNIQKSITGTLSTDFADNTASIIDDKISSSADVSIYDDRHQGKVMMLGATGKMGIGVHSNWVVLHSLFQQVPDGEKVRLMKSRDKDEAFTMTLGNFKIDGYLGQNRLLGDSTMSATEINMINQNSSTDNQKLLIMGRRNENQYTISVFSLLPNLGVTDTVIKLEDDSTERVGYADLFISQPIIRRYAELKAKYDSKVIGDVFYKEDVIQNILIKEFGGGLEWRVDDTGDTVIGQLPWKVRNKNNKEMTGQKLYNNLVDSTNETQWSIFQNFQDLDKQAKSVAEMQKILNIEGQGVGRSYFDVIDKMRALTEEFIGETFQIEELLKKYNSAPANRQNMLGKMSTATSVEERKELEDKGYVYLKTVLNVDLMILPSTPQNRKLINSTAMAYNLWKNVFPFESSAISEQISRIADLNNIKEGSPKLLDLKYDVLRGIKDYYYSFRDSSQSIFTESIETERFKLFMDTEDNTSLGKYLNTLKSNKHPLFNEAFFRDLELSKIGLEGEPSLIKYNLNEKSNYNKNEAYKYLEELSEDHRNIEEGINYTYSDLVKSLTKYALLADQANGAIGFRQYIPASVLKKYGVTSTMVRIASPLSQEIQHKLLEGSIKMLSKHVTYSDKGHKIIAESSVKNFERDVKLINNKYGANTITYSYMYPLSEEPYRYVEINFPKGNADVSGSAFFEQFLQHNLNYVPTAYIGKKYSIVYDDKREQVGLRANNAAAIKSYVKREVGGKTILYKHVGDGNYMQIETRGVFGVNEYSPGNIHSQTLFEENRVPIPGYAPNVAPPVVSPLRENGLKEHLEKVSTRQLVEEISLDPISEYSSVAKLLLPFVKDVKIVVNDFGEHKDFIAGGYLTPGDTETIDQHGITWHRDAININLQLLERKNLESIKYTLLEEILHSVTVQEVNKYINSTDTKFGEDGTLNVSFKEGYDVNSIPPYIYRLLSVYADAGKHYVKVLNGDVNEINTKHVLSNGTTNRLLDLKEFIVGVVVDPTFRQEMSQVETTNKNNLITRFSLAIKTLFKKLYRDLGITNVAEEGFNSVMLMLETNINTPKLATKPNVDITKIDTLINEQQPNVPDFDPNRNVEYTDGPSDADLGLVSNQENIGDSFDSTRTTPNDTGLALQVLNDIKTNPSQVIDVLLSNNKITKINC